MAIKYYSIPSKGQTVAILRDTEMDAINKINKCMNGFDWCFCTKKYLMPKQFRVVVKVHGDDVFSEEEGKKIAKQKLLRKYYKAFDARMDMFRSDLIILNGRVFENALDKMENV